MSTSQTLRSVRRAARERYAWPGGYPVYVMLTDGELLCADCVRSNYRSIHHSTKLRENDGWAVIGADVLWETYNGPESCAHCGAELESAYGDVTDPA